MQQFVPMAAIGATRSQYKNRIKASMVQEQLVVKCISFNVCYWLTRTRNKNRQCRWAFKQGKNQELSPIAVMNVEVKHIELIFDYLSKSSTNIHFSMIELPLHFLTV